MILVLLLQLKLALLLFPHMLLPQILATVGGIAADAIFGNINGESW